MPPKGKNHGPKRKNRDVFERRATLPCSINNYKLNNYKQNIAGIFITGPIMDIQPDLMVLFVLGVNNYEF